MSTSPFPTDPEQWIYNKADEIAQSLSRMDKLNICAVHVIDDMHSTAGKLAIENHCLKRAIKAYGEVCRLFKESHV